MTRVAVFTDNDFNKVSGVTTTLNAVLRHAPSEVASRIYTAADLESDCPDYLATQSIGVGLPWYRDMRIYWPRFGRFARALRQDGIDVVHITTPGPVGLAGRLLARRLGLPLIGSYHPLLGANVEQINGAPRAGRWMDRYMRWFYSACESLLVPARCTCDDLEQVGYTRDRFRLWARGVDASVFSPARRSARLRDAWHVDDRRPVLLYAGRLSRDKGLDLVPGIQQRLDAERIAHRLVFVGNGPMSPELQRQCPDAEFLGRVSHEVVAAAMASADIFLSPSSADTLGNVVLEAQASGLPVVVSDRGGPQEAMLNGVTGLVAQAGNAASFGDRVVRLFRHVDTRREMGIRAREHAMRQTWPSSLVPLVRAWESAATRRQTIAGGRTVESPALERIV